MPSGIIIDLFAGGGGASTGIERGLGRPVDVAINHDRVALAVHTVNHPGTQHLTVDIWHAKPARVVDGRRVALLWASPDCTHFSNAKGSKPRKQSIRSLAWAVVRWAREARPDVICVENVREFQGWGPLDSEGRPIKARMGESFRRWKRELERLGYAVDHRILDASHYGAPTRRRRLFIVARCDGSPIAWPEPTHGPGLQPFRTAAECIDWSIPCPSISGCVDVREPMPKVTAQGNHIAEVRAFLTAYYGSDGPNGQALTEPMRTVTAKHRLGLVMVAGVDYQIVDIGMRMLEPDPELLRGQFGKYADGYDLSAARTKAAKTKLIGNSVPPEVVEAIVRANRPSQESIAA